jgi:hypothetical protein
MNTPNEAQTTTETGGAAIAEQLKASKKANAAPRKPSAATDKPKSGKKATLAKKAPKAKHSSKPAKKEKATRQGSKTDTALELLKRPDGASLAEIMKAMGWQAHSVRGFLSGTVGKKMGLAVTSRKSQDGQRSYSVKA